MAGRDRNVNEITVSSDYNVPIDMDYIFADGLTADITITLKRTRDGLQRFHKVKKVDSSAFVVTVVDGASLSYPLSAEGQAAVFELDKSGDFHVFAASALGASGGLAIPEGGSVTYSPAEYSDDGSFQPIGPDLNLDPAAGTSEVGDSAYLATIMGNTFGDALTKTKNIIAGVIGKLSVTGARASTYPVAGVIAEVGDGVTEADGGFVAVLGGDSAQTNARAAFSVDNQNSVPGSGFDYVVDGAHETHDGYPAFAPLKAFARIALNAGGLPVILAFGVATDDAGIVAQVGADNTIADGSLYISHVDNAGKLFQKQNDVWVDLQA